MAGRGREPGGRASAPLVPAPSLSECHICNKTKNIKTLAFPRRRHPTNHSSPFDDTPARQAVTLTMGQNGLRPKCAYFRESKRHRPEQISGGTGGGFPAGTTPPDHRPVSTGTGNTVGRSGKRRCKVDRQRLGEAAKKARRPGPNLVRSNAKNGHHQSSGGEEIHRTHERPAGGVSGVEAKRKTLTKQDVGSWNETRDVACLNH